MRATGDPRSGETQGARAAGALRRLLRGAVLTPGDAAYGPSRRVWNATIDRRPSAIAVCADAEDVACALRVASDHGIPVTARAGGHNVAGRAVADAAMMIDLSRLREVSVNAATRRAWVQGGATWHDVDIASARHGLATTGGLVSGTGVGGFTLGGGTGWLMRRFGLAIDSLVAADVLLADGRPVRASADEHPDLFWGLRGGGAGFGVVTRFEFQLYPLTQVLAGVVIRPASEAAAALRVFRDFAREAPDEYCGLMVLLHAPPLPFLDASWHGRPVVISALCWSGEIAHGERALEPLRRFGSPLADHVGPMPYVQWQHLQDAGAPAGRWQYWKTASYVDLPDHVVDDLAAQVDRLPTPQTEIHVQHMGGAVARVGGSETAFAQRGANFFVNLIGAAAWPDAVPAVRDWARELHRGIAAQGLAARLPNFTGDDDGEAIALGGEAVAGRLAALRRRYDPEMRFATGG